MIVKRVVFLIVSAAVLCLFFQNCAPGFMVAKSQTGLFSSNSSFSFSPVRLTDEFALASTAAFRKYNVGFGSGLTLYVDADQGSDANDGTDLAPFKTLGMARATLRKSLPGLQTDAVVILRGRFILNEPFALTDADSNPNGFSVNYIGDPKKPASLNGTQIFSPEWTLVDRIHNVYTTDMGALRFRHLFVNGVKAVRARTDGVLTEAVAHWPSTVDCSRCQLPSQSSPYSAEIVVSSQWQMVRCAVTVQTDHTLIIEPTCGTGIAAMNQPPTIISWIENLPSLVLSPGQWAQDQSSGLLSYSPRPGENLDSAEFSVSHLTSLVQATGVKNISFIGLEFTGTNWDQPTRTGGFRTLQGDFYNDGVVYDWIPAAVTCEACSHVLIMNSVFDHLATSGVRFGESSKDNLFFHNHLFDISGSGLQIGETQGVTGDSAVEGTLVEDNLFESIGSEYLGSVGIFQMYAAGSKIRHNEIHSAPYTGISVGWGWTSQTSPNSHDNLIDSNLIYDVMNDLQDGGGIYLLSAQPGTVIANNYVHDLHGGLPNTHLYPFSCGIYLDNGSSQMTVTHNYVEGLFSAPSVALFLQNVAAPFATNNAVSSDAVSAVSVKVLAGPRLAF